MIFSFVLTAAVVSRTVTPGAAGPNRLAPDVALLSVASPSLGDLRFHDRAGNEVQYLLIPPPTRTPAWRAGSTLPIPATKTSSGFELDLGAALNIDRIVIAGVPAPLLKRLRLDGSGDREHWTVLAAEATIFDLPEQQLRNLEVAFPPGQYRYLRVTWDDRSSARVEQVGRVAARLYDSEPPPLQAGFPVMLRAKASELGKSRFRISLPGPHLPITAIEVQVANANVFRDASISEPRLEGSTLVPVELGSSKLRRAERDGAVAADMTIPISPPRGADLDLVIENGDSGPLTIKAIVAKLAPQPWIYFESADGAPIAATYGDPSLRPPHYDLEASRRTVEKLRPAEASWSPAVIAQPSPVPPGLPLTGAAIDRKTFRYSRAIALLPRGLTSLVLDADVLAHSASLDDIRLVDHRGNQVPYILEKRDAPLPITLHVPSRMPDGRSSIYRFTLPYDTLPSGTRLVLTTNARVFDRSVTLQRPPDETHGRDAEVLASAQWRSADPDSAPPELTLTASPRGTRVLDLHVDEGDNAPLPITSAQLLLPSYAVRFVSTGASLTLLYGDPSAAAPRYDLALLAPQLLSESAREVSLAPTILPQPAEGRRTERTIFWAVIALATVVLLFTLARLLTERETTEGA